MEALKRKRRVLKLDCSRINKQLEADPSTITAELAEVLADQLHGIQKATMEVRDQMIDLTENDNDLEDIMTEYEPFANILDSTNAKIKAISKKLSLDSSSTSNKNTTGSSKSDLKLPRIEIPMFDGDLLRWSSFHDMFTNTIHNNETLSGCQKLHYLKTALKGEAARLLEAIQITDGNYPEAWKLLNERFQNQRELVNAQLKRLFSLESLTKESSASLRNLVDSNKEVIRSLEVLGRKEELASDLLVYWNVQHLDNVTRKAWELSLTDREPPGLEKLLGFLEQRATALASLPKAAKTSIHSDHYEEKSHKKSVVHSQSFTVTCPVCSGNHKIYNCLQFKKLKVDERKKVARNKHLCFNCFSKHDFSTCQSGRCRECGGKHNTLLHESRKWDTSRSSSSDRAESQETTNHQPKQAFEHNLAANSATFGGGQVFLQTAIIMVQDIWGQFHECRALLDSCAQSSFILESFAQRLGLSKIKLDHIITGVGDSMVTTKQASYVTLHISSKIAPDQHFHTKAVLLKKISNYQPIPTATGSSWKHLQGLQLADPNFDKAGKIDALIGAELYAKLIHNEKIDGPTGTPSAIRTIFGWTIIGADSQGHKTQLATHHSANTKTDTLLVRLWELDQVPEAQIMTPEEVEVEEHYEKTHYRKENGRYVVRLPFKQQTPNLGDSRSSAHHSLIRMERRLDKNAELQQEYASFMNEYEQLNHMEIVPSKHLDKPESESFYMPHHPVIKESSSTTKIRIVFNASAKSNSGISLNDKLKVGPKLQDNLVDILLRFRLHAVALTGDIRQMYRQVEVHPDDRSFQRILWRNSPTEAVKTYELKTVTYGTASASYLAIKSLRQLATDECQRFPAAIIPLQRDFYVDDFISGENSIEKVISLRKNITNLLGCGKFEIRKWASNRPEVLTDLSPEQQTMSLQFMDTSDIKALGMHWMVTKDYLHFVSPNECHHPPLTRRKVLSQLASIFDPLGLVSPITIRQRIFFQQLWATGLDWDDPLPLPTVEQWKQIQEDLLNINQLKFPRFVSAEKPVRQELHGFSDASERAFAGVIYLRTISASGVVTVKLLVAKNKVAPSKAVSLPRLELCGAVLLAKLIHATKQALKINFDKICAWTDSSIVLTWITSHCSRWKTFVANRVSQAQELVPPDSWRLVSGICNPADVASRGSSVSDLARLSSWWAGPDWLSSHDVDYINNEPLNLCGTHITAAMVEVNSLEDHQLTTPQEDGIRILLKRCSSYTTLIRVTAYVLRFIESAKHKSRTCSNGLQVTELQGSVIVWIRLIQHEAFLKDINSITNQQPISKTSILLPLSPFLDQQGILRVGGRLQKANVSYDVKHPILLPSRHKFTELFVMGEHKKHLHAPPAMLLSIISERYWILHGKSTVRKILRKCITCARHHPTLQAPFMGNLPSARVTPSRPFAVTGVDYAGPYLLRASAGRGRAQFKGYIALFICLATKALHLEAVSGMSASHFLAAFRRFVARRGLVHEMLSDCGSNFVAADKELRKMIRATSPSFHDEVAKELANDGIKWSFNPPYSPHFGGIWEAGVKSVKYHIKRVAGNVVWTFEEFATLLCQTEACLNSRPLSSSSSDPNDFHALTPGHFLVGSNLLCVPEPSPLDTRVSYVARFQLVQRALHHFWKRWHREYLHQLHPRSKWCRQVKTVAIGDLVTVHQDSSPPGSWHLGRISELHPGEDGIVRVVSVRTPTGIFKRPIVKISVLPMEIFQD